MAGEPARLNVELDRDLHDRMNKCIPWGIKSHVIRAIMELVVDAVEREGPIMLGAILNKAVSMEMKGVFHRE